VVAKAVGLADQVKAEIRKALLHPGDQRIDAVMAVAPHQGVDIFRILGPMLLSISRRRLGIRSFHRSI
jgi:hypothetical protein